MRLTLETARNYGLLRTMQLIYTEQDIVGLEGVPGSPRAVHNGVNISCIKDISMLSNSQVHMRFEMVDYKMPRCRDPRFRTKVELM